MTHCLPPDLPRYQCLEEASRRYPELDPSACEAYLHLLRAGDAVAEVGVACFGEHQISGSRFKVLMLLNRAPDEPASPADLAEMGGVSRATISGVLDTLERDGLVTRNHHPADRRGVLVQLTRSGKGLLHKVCPDFFSRVASLIQPLNPAERKQLVKLLQKVQTGVANLEKLPPDVSKVATSVV